MISTIKLKTFLLDKQYLLENTTNVSEDTYFEKFLQGKLSSIDDIMDEIESGRLDE